MLDHNQLIDATMLVAQKCKNKWFALIVVAYDEVDDTIEINEYHQRWNIKIAQNPITLLLCQTGRSLT